MSDLILVLSRSPEQQAAFEKFVAGQYDANSPDFHQWLTPDEVGTKFGPSETDIDTISRWLIGHGLSVDQVTKDRMSIRFSGTAAQVESAFHTEIHNLEVKGVSHIGNMSDPQIPAALAPAVVGVKALHNFFPKPAHHLGSQVRKDAATGRWERTANRLAAARLSGAVSDSPVRGAATSRTDRPQFGINVGGTSPYLEEDVAPFDFAAIYNVLPLWNAGIDGTGQTIAIAGTSDIDPTDVATFRNFFGLPTSIPADTPIRVRGNSEPLTVCTDTTGNVPYPTNPCEQGDLIENTLDVEWSGSVAKNAQIVLVASYPSSDTDDNLYDSESYIVNNVGTATSPVFGAHIMNVSYGLCELGNGTAGNVEYYNLWQTAYTEGIAVFVAAGDAGSASCDDGGDEGGNLLPYPAEFGLSVSGLASTPWDTAVGGTDFNWCPLLTSVEATSTATECQPGPYWSTTNTANASAPESSALGYIPEVPWNDTCSSPLALPYMEWYWSGNPYETVKDAETGCNLYVDEAQALASAGDYDLLYLVDTIGGGGGASGCVVNDGSDVSSCTGASVTTAGGSVSLVNDGWPKPSWQQQSNNNIPGLPSDGVRDIPDVSFFASDGYVSSSAYLMCASATNTNNSPCAYSTYSVPFYQEVGGTSVATPAMAGVMALINQKAGAPQGNPNSALYALAATQTYSSCSAETVTTSSQCYFNDIDTGTNAMPCDAVDITANCSTTQSTFGYSDEIGILTGYSAVQGYDQATGLGSLNVANVVNSWVSTIGTGATTVTVVPTPATVSVGQSVSVLVTVSCSGSCTGSPTPTGSVTLTGGGYTSEPEPLTGGTYTFTIPAGSLSGGSDTLTASYAGDAKYASNTGSGSVTVNKLNAVVSATPSVVPPATIPSNQTLMVTGTVTCTGTCPVSPAVPTGTVTVSYGSTYTSLPAQVNSGGSYSVTITPNSLTGPSGTDTLTVLYSGDANYNPSSTTTSVSVTFFQVLNPTLTVTVTPSTATVDSGSPIQVTVEVTGAGTTPSGTVTLAGGGYSLTQQTLQTPQSGVASVSFNISANTLNSDPNFPTSDTLTADYQGDLDYAQAIKMVTLTVVQSSFSLAATPPASVSPGSTTTSTVSVSSPSDYTGAITFPATCALTGYPAGVTASTPSLPTCALTGNGKVTVTDGVPSGTVTYTVSTTGTATQALLNGNQGAPAARQHGSGWFEAAGGTALAALFLFLVPAGSRKGRQMFSVLLLMTAGSFAVIGCGGGSSTPPSLATPTVTVTPSVTGLSVNSPLTVTVNVSGSSGTPTGGVTISGGGYSSSSQLSSGSVSFNIPANAFSTIGSVTLTASYLGDSNYNSGSGSATITVNNVPTIAGNYTFTVTPTGNPVVTPAVSTTFTVTVN
jgi:hypothetical protein